MNEFQARVQYNDFTGTVAADRADDKSFIQYLRDNGLAGEDEELAGYRIVFNENPGQEILDPGVVTYLCQAKEFEKRPGQVRAVEVNIPTAKLFSFLKRFDLVMTRSGMNLDDATVIE